MTFALYILYAVVQAILVARYGMKEKDHPVLLVVGATIFAPVVSALVILWAAGEAIKWLVTYKQK